MKYRDSFSKTVYEMSNMNLSSDQTKMEIKSVSNHNKENLYYHLKLRQWRYSEATTKKASFSSTIAFCCSFHVFGIENSFRNFFFKRVVVVTAKGVFYKCLFYEYITPSIEFTSRMESKPFLTLEKIMQFHCKIRFSFKLPYQEKKTAHKNCINASRPNLDPY